MEQENFDSWEQFKNRIDQLSNDRAEKIDEQGGSISPFLFRGQGDDSWHLETTLDRMGSRPWSFSKYFLLIMKAKPQIEAFTGLQWKIDDLLQLREWASQFDNYRFTPFPGYDYLVYLRHHGFPSPMLDWTRSLFIAAYFAFTQPRSEHVAIYIYQEYSGHGKVGSLGSPGIKRFGPYVRSDLRHFDQKSEYTIAAQYQDDEWWYAPHEDVFSNSSLTQDLLWKFTLPASERTKVLRSLDAHNLNDYSLFRTEESLLNTIAVRELELREIDL